LLASGSGRYNSLGDDPEIRIRAAGAGGIDDAAEEER